MTSQALHAHHRHQQKFHKGQTHSSSNSPIQSGSDPLASCLLGLPPSKIRHTYAAPSLCTIIVHPVYLQRLTPHVHICPNSAESRPSKISLTPITSLISPHNHQGFPHLTYTTKTQFPPQNVQSLYTI